MLLADRSGIEEKMDNSEADTNNSEADSYLRQSPFFQSLRSGVVRKCRFVISGPLPAAAAPPAFEHELKHSGCCHTRLLPSCTAAKVDWLQPADSALLACLPNNTGFVIVSNHATLATCASGAKANTSRRTPQ
jgi:hypothetical protein